MERMRCPPVPFHYYPPAGQNEHGSGLPVPPRHSAKRQGPPHDKGRHTHHTYQVNIQSSDVAEENQFFFMPDDDTETEEQICERKLRARKKNIDDNNKKPHSGGTITETTSSDQEVTIFQTEVLVTRTLLETTNEYDGPLKTMRQQQDQDNVLRNYKLRSKNPTTSNS